MRRTVAGIGRTLVTLGLLILLFVAYQLWGTGLITARAQDHLKGDFAKAQQQYNQENDVVAPPSTPPTTARRRTTTTTSPARPAPPTPAEGDVEGWITIPKIGLHMLFVEGTSRDDLKKGPGHYPGTPLPGTLGNAAIAGHRTTYLHPFYDLDKLVPGDEIIIQTVAGSFAYIMTKQLIVAPTDTWVVANTKTPQLTLTSCNPKYSAAQRIVVKAKLIPNRSARVAKPRPPAHGKATPQTTPPPSLSQGLSGQSRSIAPAIQWGLAVLFVGLAWWWVFRRWRHPMTWVVGVVPFLAVLFAFYTYFNQALPAGI